MGKAYQEKRADREFIVLSHISAAVNREICGYGAVVSLSQSKRVVIHGTVNKSDATAYAVYAELAAVLDVIDIFIKNNIKNAQIKLSREKAMNAMTGKEIIDGCSDIVRKIIDSIGDNNYSFALEEENKESMSYIMAERAAGLFRFKNGYKWRPDCAKVTSELFQFCVKEYYTRKNHESYEYLNFAELLNQYTGPRHNIAVPLNVQKEISLRSSRPEYQDTAAMFYKCGFDPKTACLFAGRLSGKDKDTVHNELHDQIKIMILEQDRKNRSRKMSKYEIQMVINRIAVGYYQGNYPLRTLKEAVLDAYLEILSKYDNTKESEPVKKKIIYAINGKSPQDISKKCSMCGKKIQAICSCKNQDIANILFGQGYANHFCSVECFAKAAGLTKSRKSI